MDNSDNTKRVRLLATGGVLGFIVGLILGLMWAWYVDPAFYSGGAYPNELSDLYQQTYAKSVSEAYLTTRDVGAAAERLNPFTPEQKVTLLANVAKEFNSKGQVTEANLVGDLAATLKSLESWSNDAVGAGLSAAGAESGFSEKLGMVPEAPAGQPQVTGQEATTEPAKSSGGIGRTLLILLAVLLALGLIAFLLSRIKPKRKPKIQSVPEEMMVEAGSGLQPLRQWIGTYNFGQESYDESFTVETDKSDFLGECGMGILEGFASGNPKRVLAFDVWLFDKTDIRTLSVPVMSKYAFEDPVLRSKLQPDVTPVLAAEGTVFDIETTALIVKARIEEVGYGDGPPPMSYFTNLKISLSAYLKSDVDVSGTMPIPEGYS